MKEDERYNALGITVRVCRYAKCEEDMQSSGAAETLRCDVNIADVGVTPAIYGRCSDECDQR